VLDRLGRVGGYLALLRSAPGPGQRDLPLSGLTASAPHLLADRWCRPRRAAASSGPDLWQRSNRESRYLCLSAMSDYRGLSHSGVASSGEISDSTCSRLTTRCGDSEHERVGEEDSWQTLNLLHLYADHHGRAIWRFRCSVS